MKMKQRFGTGPEGWILDTIGQFLLGYAPRQENPGIPKDVSQLIFSYFPPDERMKFAQVSKTWRDDLYSDPFWKRTGAESYQDFVRRFKLIRNDPWSNHDCETLKRRVLSGEYTLDLAEQIFFIWEHNYNDDRVGHLPDELRLVLAYNFPINNRYCLVENAGIMAMLDGTIDLQEAKNIDSNVLEYFIENEIPNEALRRNLITLTEANQYPLDNLKLIFSREKCLDAIEAGWFNIKESAGVSQAVLELLLPLDHWYDIYGDVFWKALSDGVFTLDQADSMRIEQLKVMMCERGIRFLEMGLITRYQASDMDVENLKYLISWEGEEAILENKVTINQLLYFPIEILKILMSERGERILENHIILRSAACEIGVEKLKALVSERGEQALIEKRFSVEDVLNLQEFHLEFMLDDLGFEMMDPTGPLITTKQCKKLTLNHMSALFTEVGFIALKEKLVNVDLIPSISALKLVVFLTDQGREMLKKGYITFDNSMSFNKFRIIMSDTGIKFFEEGIINHQVVCDMDEETLDALISEAGERALKAKIFTVEDILELPSDCLYFILNQWGRIMMDPQNPLVTIEELKILTLDQMETLFSDNGFSALSEGLLNIDQIISVDPDKLMWLLSYDGLRILQKGYATFEELKKLTAEQMQSLFTDNGFTALREGLLNIDQILSVKPEKLKILLTNKVLRILRKPHVTFADIVSASNNNTLTYLICKYDQCEILFSKGIVKFSDFAHAYNFSFQVFDRLDAIMLAMNVLELYSDTLVNLNPRLPSLNKNHLRHEKGAQLRKLFFEVETSVSQDSSSTEPSSLCSTTESESIDLESISESSDNDLIKSILSNPDNPLIQNCSRLPFKFFKMKSRRHGYRNPYLDRLCESETEVRLVQLDAARAA